jgi:hypothetical protein
LSLHQKALKYYPPYQSLLKNFFGKNPQKDY